MDVSRLDLWLVQKHPVPLNSIVAIPGRLCPFHNRLLAVGAIVSCVSCHEVSVEVALGNTMSTNLSTAPHRNRRRFLASSVALSGCVGYWIGSEIVHAAPGPEITPEAMDRLSKKIRGTLVQPSDGEYDRAKRVFYWNPKLQSQPKLIVRCGGEDDVRYAIEFARDHQLEVAVRGGGHAYLAWGSSNGLVIDLSPLKRIEVDPARRRLVAQGGALAGEVARAAGHYGLVPVLGQCPGVGAAGVTLGGGLGWLSGLFGACCENLHSATVVNANAEVLEADEQTDPDLLWAMRGAGANFGATTSLELQLHPVASVVAGDVHFQTSDAQAVLRGFRELMQNVPDGLQANLNLTRGPAGVFISLCHVGTDAEVASTLGKIQSIAKTTKVEVKRQAFANLAEKAAVTSPANVPAPVYRAVQAVYRQKITDEVIEVLVDQLGSAPVDAIFGLSHYMHGAVCRLKPTDTAFPHRQEHSIQLRVAYSWNDAHENEQRLAWGERWLQQLRPVSNESQYANFQTYHTTVGSPSLFGVNHGRLMTLKQKHDPGNFFRRNANIAPALQP